MIKKLAKRLRPAAAKAKKRATNFVAFVWGKTGGRVVGIRKALPPDGSEP